LEKTNNRIIEWYAINIYFPKLIKKLDSIYGSYLFIPQDYTELFLAILLNKKIEFLDNSYGKTVITIIVGLQIQ
jgi:hypothetical protein